MSCGPDRSSKSYHFVSFSCSNERPVTGDSLLLFHPHPPLTGRTQQLFGHVAVILVLGRSLLMSSGPVVLRVLLQRSGRVLGRRRTAEQRIEALQASHGRRFTLDRSFFRRESELDRRLTG